MSMELYVCWRGALEIESAKLKGALDTAGFEAKILHDFNTADGFWPVEIAGHEVGVEIYHDYDLQELIDDCPLVATALDGRDKLITFVWHSRAAEAATGLALAAALARLGDVLIYEPSDDVILSPEKCIEDARDMFEAAKEEERHRKVE